MCPCANSGGIVVTRIKRHVPNLRRIPYGKHIIARIEKLTGKPLA